jgi:hypothetical protein
VFSNKRFELIKPALALDPVVRQGWITIPAGAVIRTLVDPNTDTEEDQMIDVIWDGRMLAMIAIEVATGGKEVDS